MVRLLGILLGSLISISVFVAAIGVPTLRPHDPVDHPVMDSSIAAMQPAEKAEPDVIATVPDLPLEEEPVEVEPPAPVVSQNDDISQAPPPDRFPGPAQPVPEETSVRWYAFWSPFRSRVAANGFVAQLQRVTGLDYRVVSVKPGVYEVAFAYADDADIEVSLTEISAATGLAIPES